MLWVGLIVPYDGIGLVYVWLNEKLWCFNELKGLLILNLITLHPPSRLLAFTLIVIYGSSTLCFLINHLVIDVILFCSCPCIMAALEQSCLFGGLVENAYHFRWRSVFTWLQCLLHNYLCLPERNSPSFWEWGNSRLKINSHRKLQRFSYETKW